MDDGAGLTHDNLDDGIISIWGEGNNQCDCNRALFFGYAIGLKYEDMDTECGDGGYSVNILKGDECIYSEF